MESVPQSFHTVSSTVYVPASSNVCTGFCSSDVVPSPKFHNHVSTLFSELSVNWTVSGAYPEVGSAVNAATGSRQMALIGAAVESEPQSFWTVRVTVYVPTSSNVCTGFCCVEVDPSPKFQFHEMTLFRELSVNWTVSGAYPESGSAVNCATGSRQMALIGAVVESVPQSFHTVSSTVYDPTSSNVCVGFCSSEVAPSPNSQNHAFTLFSELSVNWTVSGAYPESGSAVNAATGWRQFVVIGAVVESVPQSFHTVSSTVYSPIPVNVCVGFCSSEVAPSPKSHDHAFTLFSELSVN